MASSNQIRNKNIMDNFIKELKKLPEEFEIVSMQLLNDTISVAEIYAKDLTPSVTGEAREKWKTRKAYKVTNGFRAKLYNNSEHIFYINYGHRMEKHFVPGKWVGDKFEYEPDSEEGVIMGAKTKYVKGKFMLEKASGRAENYLAKAANKKLEQLKRKYENE